MKFCIGPVMGLVLACMMLQQSAVYARYVRLFEINKKIANVCMEFAIIAFTRRMGLFCQTNKQNPGIITVKKKRKESKDLHTIVFLLMVVQILKGTSIVAG